MPDLDSTIKAPFVSVFDMLGKELVSTKKDRYSDLSIVSLRYKYDDEDDDICTIKLQMSNPTALDILKIERGTRLQVIWGYLGGPIGPLVIMVVRDMTSKYGSSLIYTELVCTDYMTFIKTFRSDDVGMGSYISYIQAQIFGKFNIVIKDRGQIIYAQTKIEWKEDEYIGSGVRPTYEVVMFDPIFEAIFKRRGMGVSEEEEEELKDPWFVEEDHPVRRHLSENQGILTANRSTFVVIQDIFRKCPRGPWFVTGRGETLFIHNRNLGRDVYKEYKYKDELGYLIDFTPKTKFENFDKQVVSYAGMDPKERINWNVDDYQMALYTQRNPKEILEDKEITNAQKTTELKKYFNLRYKSYPRWGIVAVPGAIVYPGTERQWFQPGRFDKPYRLKEPHQYLAAKDHTNVVNPDPALRSEEGGFDPTYHDPILRAVWYTMPLMSYSEAVNVTNSHLRKLAMDKEEAKIILEGDPYIISEYTVRITNVHSQHAGQYYIKKCEHIITSQGYKTQLDCLKIIPEAILTTLGNISKEEYIALDDITRSVFDKQYKREQELFGPEVKIVTPVQGYIYTNVGAYERSEMGYEKQGYTNDGDIEELIRLSKLPDSYVSFDPESK